MFLIYTLVFSIWMLYNSVHGEIFYKGVVQMKCNKLVVYAICGFVFVAAAAAAVYVFRNEIADFFVDIKARIDEKKLHRNGEFADYADI